MTHDGGSHRWECPESGCPEFVAGGATSPRGMTEEELRADTEREMKAVRLPSDALHDIRRDGEFEALPTDRDDKK